MAAAKISWPEGKDFAFSVFDDTDGSTLENVRDVYSFLADCGFRTTKSVWPLSSNGGASRKGATCQDADYLEWLIGLQSTGFEIAYHMAAARSSPRAATLRGLDRFASLFGHYPRSMAHHVGCLENLYWGHERLTGFNRRLYRLLTAISRKPAYQGHREDSPYFWGDICRRRIKYVRNFVYPEINTLRLCPVMPYHDPQRPYVRYWFASSEGSSVASFKKQLSEEHQDRLEAEGGACIIYTHFAFGFLQNGKMDPGFRKLMRRLSEKNGWFVPVSDLLDYLLSLKRERAIEDRERRRIERRWLSRKIFTGTT